MPPKTLEQRAAESQRNTNRYHARKAERLNPEQVEASRKASQDKRKAGRLARRGNLPAVSVVLSPARQQALYGVAEPGDAIGLGLRAPAHVAATPPPPRLSAADYARLRGEVSCLRREQAATQRALDYYQQTYPDLFD